MRTNIVSVLLAIFLSLNGCIVSKTPEEDALIIYSQDVLTFCLQALPESGPYTWYLDGEPLPGAVEACYTYAPQAADCGEHTLVASAGADSRQWRLHVLDDTFEGTDPCVTDVEAAFAALPERGTRLALWDEGLIPWPRYTQAVLNEIGIDNHFQGIQRLRKGPCVVISGSNILDRTGSIFIACLGSRASEGAFGSNIGATGLPKPVDRLIMAVEVASGQLWHAGGMDVEGDILAIPLEEYQTDLVSKIFFYDLSRPDKPRRLDTCIDRTQGEIVYKSGAVALARLVDGTYLLASWDTRELHFYRSCTSEIADGFDQKNVAVWHTDALVVGEGLPEGFSAQTINFVRQTDGALYLVALDGNNGDLGPFLPFLEIENIAELFCVEFPGEAPLAEPRITKLASRRFSSGEEDNPLLPSWRIPSYCDFVAAAGVYLPPQGGLALYSAPHYRSAGLIRGSEFWESTAYE